MRKNLPLFIVLLTSSLFFTSCYSPKPIVVLEAKNNVGDWFFGQQVIRMEENGVDLSVAYERESPYEITMNLRIVNRTDEEVLIDPDRYYYTWFSSEFDTIPKGLIRAENPEFRLMNLDYEITASDAAQANQEIFDLVATTVEATATVAAVVKDRPDEEIESIQILSEARRGISSGVALSREIKYMSLNEQRRMWSREVLRKTTLPPNASIDGKVIFRPSPTAKRCRFMFPIGQTCITVDFRQWIYRR